MTLLSSEQITNMLNGVDSEWVLSEDQKVISRKFQFKGFYKTMAFINAVAWLAQKNNHHPDVHFGYNYCTVQYTTHDAGGLTSKDFDIVKQIDALYF